MPLKPHHLILTGLAGTAIFFLVKSLRAAKNVLIVPQIGGLPRFQGLTRLVIPLDATLQNPTNGRLKFTFPHVQVLLDGMPFAVSASRPEMINVGPNESIGLRDWLRAKAGADFDLEINLASAIFAAPALIQLAKGSGQAIELKARITATAFPVGVPLPDGMLIKQDFTIPIGKGGNS
jgi:hypothetical protein